MRAVNISLKISLDVEPEFDRIFLEERQKQSIVMM